MDGIAQNENNKPEGGANTAQPTPEVKPATATENPTPATENPAVEDHTNTGNEPNGASETSAPTPEGQPSEETAKEMTAEQFDKYNETLRRVSKTAKLGIETRYNAFEDAEVKAAVKKAVMAGETLDIQAIAKTVIERHTKPTENPTPAPETETIEPKPTDTSNDEVLSLRVENALLKAGVKADRLAAATKLFIAEGADLSTATEWIKKYPEWGNESGGITFTQAPPVAGKTAPTPNDQPPLSDFDKKVQAARKARGLDT